MTFTYPTPTTIDTFYTNSEGYLVTPEKLEYGSGYSLVEVQAPYGYVLDSTPVYFDVTEDNSSEEGGVTVIEVTKPTCPERNHQGQQNRRGIFLCGRKRGRLPAGV